MKKKVWRVFWGLAEWVLDRIEQYQNWKHPKEVNWDYECE